MEGTSQAVLGSSDQGKVPASLSLFPKSEKIPSLLYIGKGPKNRPCSYTKKNLAMHLLMRKVLPSKLGSMNNLVLHVPLSTYSNNMLNEFCKGKWYTNVLSEIEFSLNNFDDRNYSKFNISKP